MNALKKAHSSPGCRAIKAKRKKLEAQLSTLSRQYQAKFREALKKNKKKGTAKKKKAVKKRRR